MQPAQPLAELLRPAKLADIIGQDHIIGQGKLVSRLVENDSPFSLILWGPPGSGKTTIARAIAGETDAKFVELSAVTATKKDVLTVIDDAKVNRRLGQRTILFIDEIHRFSKSQQDTFLPHIESGLISFIGATTENPSFEVIAPLISRSQVIVLNKISDDHMLKIIQRAIKSSPSLSSLPSIKKKDLSLIITIADGDARKALGILDSSSVLAGNNQITKDIIQQSAQTKIPKYDKNGDMHYDTISAFIKSMRGSNPSATLYYLARILEAGEDPKFIARRMVVFASEDIGLAAPAALNLAVSTFLAVERIGMPECKYNLFHCATVLAKAEKSRTVTEAMNKATMITKQYGDLPIPLWLRNAPTKLMDDLGYGKGYQWQSDFKPDQGFLPTEIADLDLF